MSMGRTGVGARIAVLAAGLVLLGGCTASDGTARQVEVGMEDMRFAPATIELKASEPVRLVFRNDGKLVHDFTVRRMPTKGVATHGGEAGHGHDASGMALHLALRGRRSGEIQFTPLEPGEYEYICTEPGHQEAGMRGILRVSPRTTD